MIEDREYASWKRNYPRFPGVAKCVELLHRRNVHGAAVDIICLELVEHAATHEVELIAAFRAESDERVRSILLGVLGEAKLPAAMAVFVEELQSNDERLRTWVEEGLRGLDTKEARRALWEAGRAKRGGRSPVRGFWGSSCGDEAGTWRLRLSFCKFSYGRDHVRRDGATPELRLSSRPRRQGRRKLSS